MTTLLDALAIGLLAVGAVPAEPHITPVVELVPRSRAVRQILEKASRFYVRKVLMGPTEVTELRSRAGWVPEEKEVRLFIGRDPSGREIGSVLLMKSDSRHGPIRLAVGFGPSGVLSHVVITHATEETVPWVRDIVDAGFLEEFRGRSEDTVDATLDELRGKLGAMPMYMAEVVTRGVHRAMALRSVASSA